MLGLPQRFSDQDGIIRTCVVRELFADFSWMHIFGGDDTRGGSVPTAMLCCYCCHFLTRGSRKYPTTHPRSNGIAVVPCRPPMWG